MEVGVHSWMASALRVYVDRVFVVEGLISLCRWRIIQHPICAQNLLHVLLCAIYSLGFIANSLYR